MTQARDTGLRYSAFISYNHRDRGWANWLHRRMERYAIPAKLRGRATRLGVLGARLPPVFQDRAELAASADLAQSVRDALAQSASLIVICSPAAAQSRWVNEEIRTFEALGRRDAIQLLVVAGEPRVPTGPDDPLACFPPALFETGRPEPLAADVRPEADGKRGALLKLLAGVLGVGYDDLRRRDQARRQARLAIVAAASAIGCVLMSGLAVFAFLSRNEALAQRDIARQKTATAERTVQFVQSLFEVSDPSEAKGAQLTAKEILAQGRTRIAGALGDEPNVKAELMTTLSQVYLGLGSYRSGDAIIRESLALPVDDPGVRARQLLALAESQTRQADYARAIASYGRALALARDPRRGNPALIGPILVGRGEARSATDAFAAAERDIRAGFAADRARLSPDDPALARYFEALGFNAVAAGRPEQARLLFERALAIRIPAQGSAHPKVSEDLNALGAVAYLQRDSVAAEAYWRRAIKSDELVLGANHPDVANTLNNLALVLLERRAFTEARPLLRRSIAITLAERSETHDDLAFPFANLAMVERGLGNRAEAAALLHKALAAADLHHHRSRSPILAELADLACTGGDITAGLALLDRAAPITRADYPDDPWRAAWLANTRGFCVARGGERARGRALIAASMTAIRTRWPARSLYRVIAEQRLARA